MVSVDEIEEKCSGILCGNKKTSCADQLAKAVRMASKKENENTWIKPYKREYYPEISSIWLETNIKAHNFIDEEYWIKNKDVFKKGVEEATVYVYFDEVVKGFIGLSENYIAGLFVKDTFQNKGIGYALLEKAKETKEFLTLDVYEKNKNAVKLYLKNGFVIEKTFIDKNTNSKTFRMSWKRGI